MNTTRPPKQKAPRLATLPVDAVIDHSDGVMAAPGTAHPQCQALPKLLDSGRAWIKLCSYRASSTGGPWSDVAPNGCRTQRPGSASW
jgi:predicted TIM-barrel fold metal-dependent hydrolase